MPVQASHSPTPADESAGPRFPALDADKCTACRLCEVACVSARYPDAFGRAVADLAPEPITADHPLVLERRRLAIRDSVQYRDPVESILCISVDVCVHCKDSPCVPVCPHNALVRFPGGRIELIEPRCTGCGACIAACPYKAIRRVTELSIAVKCDGCAPMDRPGHVVPIPGGPACVAACPTAALSMVALLTVEGRAR